MIRKIASRVRRRIADFYCGDWGIPLTIGFFVLLATFSTALSKAQTDVRVATSQTVSAPAQTAQSTTAAQVLASNARRRQVIVQNTGTTVIKLVLGTGTPTQTAYTVALGACAAANDGTGGVFVSDVWRGAVQAISNAAGGTLVVTEITL